MKARAAGLCPSCDGYLMIFPEDLIWGWCWKCHHCSTLFFTPNYPEATYYEDEEGDDPDSGDSKPKGATRNQLGKDDPTS